MLIKKELLSIPMPAQVGKQRTAICSIHSLPRSGKVLAIDYYDAEGKLSGRLYTDAKNAFSVNHVGEIDETLQKKYTTWSNYYCSSGNERDYTNRADVLEFLGISGGDNDSIGDPIMSWAYKKYREKEKLKQEKIENRKNKYSRFFSADVYSKQEISEIKSFAEAQYKSSYGIIDHKKTQSCECGKCHKVFHPEIRARSKSSGICPNCGIELIYVTEKGEQKSSNSNQSVIYATHKHGVVALSLLTVTRQVKLGETDYLIDVAKVNIYPDKENKSYLYSFSKPIYWSCKYWLELPGGEMYDCERIPVYTKNFKRVFGARWHGLNIAEVTKDLTGKSIDYLLNNAFYGRAEYLIKSGLEQFAYANPYFLKKLMKLKKGEKPSFMKFFSVLPDMRAVYSECEVSFDEYWHIYRFYPNEYISAELIREARELGITTLYNDLSEVSFKSLVNYMRKQTLRNGYEIKLSLSLYSDYLTLCKKLEISLNKKSLRFPKDIKLAHDELVKACEQERIEAQRKALEAKMSQFKKVCRKLKSLNGYSNGIYTICVPESFDDFLKEGIALNNCVGRSNYFDKMADGKTNIFFLRRVNDMQRSFYCMEMSKEGVIKQLFGYSNCLAPDDIRNFADEFAVKYRKMFSKTAAVRCA